MVKWPFRNGVICMTTDGVGNKSGRLDSMFVITHCT
jgi:hypothetical protein